MKKAAWLKFCFKVGRYWSPAFDSYLTQCETTTCYDTSTVVVLWVGLCIDQVGGHISKILCL